MSGELHLHFIGVVDTNGVTLRDNTELHKNVATLCSIQMDHSNK